jgi:hypothetical protein
MKMQFQSHEYEGYYQRDNKQTSHSTLCDLRLSSEVRSAIFNCRRNTLVNSRRSNELRKV